MIPAEIIKKIKQVHIKSSRTVNTMLAGRYKSVFRGSGIEFEEVREYSPGDDVKSIDWKVSARLGKPFIKLYREERESIVMLLIDMSASLKFGTFSDLKLEKAAEIASVLAFSAIKNNDKAGAIFFTDKVEKYIPPKKGSAHVWRLIKEIFTFKPEGKNTDISSALDFFAKVTKKSSLCFIISDFLDKGNYIKNLKTARYKHEIIGVMLSDKGDFTLPEQGIVTLSDFETGKIQTLDASSFKTRKFYAEYKNKEYRNSLDALSKAKTDVLEISTESSVADALSKYFIYKKGSNIR
ncbi:MAG: DUF58 domain-containing protein [Desulfobacteraceae bacterium]|nr:DUF58 domain-containing protein [Desulfobacteraceae bacterium]